MLDLALIAFTFFVLGIILGHCVITYPAFEPLWTIPITLFVIVPAVFAGLILAGWLWGKS